MAELLLELLSEEIPARMQARAAKDLERLVGQGLEAAGLAFDSAHAFVTPRRLALVVDGLPLAQPDVTEEKRGPRVDASDKAVEGFLKSNGLTRDQLEERQAGKGTFYFATVERKGRPTAQVLGGLVPEAVRGLPWPKSMRWGDGALRWVRPLQGVLCLFDGEIVAFELEGGPAAANTTRGHRFMAPEAFEVSDFADYREKLRHARVLLDQDERRAVIRDQAAAMADGQGLSVVEDEALLTEVTGLVEWPVVMIGGIDPAFMDLPEEVLVAALAGHQKYFSLRDPGTGKLAPKFIFAANLEAPDGGAIVAGNERVLRARLADAKFFWDQDRKTTLASRVPALDGIVYHARLGSVGDKARRMAVLAPELAAAAGADVDAVARAAELCKADLVTGMVGEFPGLQGTMGGYYAGHDGEPDEVAAAIAGHYQPQGPGARCPDQPVAVALALADKVDTLAQFFAIGEKPTGSRDLFALRRAGLGIIRLIVENRLRLPLRPLFHNAASAAPEGTGGADAVVKDMLAFIADRLKVHLREQGVRHDLITAVFELGQEDDLIRILARVEALGEFLKGEDGANLLTAYKRASNILRIEEKKDGEAYEGEITASFLKEDEEKKLHEELASAARQARESIEAEAFSSAMEAMARLRAPVDSFFDEVTVNCDDADLRRNRLLLLSGIRSTLDAVADFSKIEG